MRHHRPTDLAALVPAQVPDRPSRRHGVLRERHWGRRPQIPSRRYVNACSIDPALDWDLTDGAIRLLLLILSLAGGPGRYLVTFTVSLATQLGRTSRTIRNYYRELEAGGYLERWHDTSTNQVILRVTAKAYARLGASAVPEERKRTVPLPWRRPRQGRKVVSAIDPSPQLTPSGTGESQRQKEERLAREDAQARLKAQVLIPPGADDALARVRQRLEAKNGGGRAR